MAVHECLRMQKPNSYRDGIFKLVPFLNFLCIGKEPIKLIHAKHVLILVQVLYVRFYLNLSSDSEDQHTI
jgi:hypothetical protein